MEEKYTGEFKLKNQIGVNLLETEEYIRYKQQEEELENLRKIEKEHQKLNGELREEIKRLNNIINKLEHDFESYKLEYLQDTYQGSLADFIEVIV